MKESIEIMKDAIVGILDNNVAAIYLYGSVTLNDFKLGWSDIDILCLTQTAITDEQAIALVALRQDLSEKDQDNPYYRLFEGAILPLNTLINKSPNKVVYWGTSGQKITDTYYFDSFSKYELLTSGILISGHDEREKIPMPTFYELRNDVINHYHTIRKYAAKTNESIYSCGWLLDIARGIYTLRTGKVIAKTAAGEWALKNDICPVAESLSKAIKVRKNPLYYKNSDSYKKWASMLGSEIQIFADILEYEINQSQQAQAD